MANAMNNSDGGQSIDSFDTWLNNLTAERNSIPIHDTPKFNDFVNCLTIKTSPQTTPLSTPPVPNDNTVQNIDWSPTVPQTSANNHRTWTDAFTSDKSQSLQVNANTEIYTQHAQLMSPTLTTLFHTPCQ